MTGAMTGAMTGRRPAAGETAPAVRPPVGRRDHRTLALVASVALVGASIAAFASIYSAADHKVPAIVVVRPVAQGQLLTSADLGEADVAISGGVDFVPVAEATFVSGKRATAAIPPGSLLTMGDLTRAPAIVAGDAIVGVALKDGAYPASGLSPGDQVMVVQTAAPGSAVAVPSTGSSSPTSTGQLTTGSGVTISGTSAVGTDSVVLVQQADVFAVSAPMNSSGTYSLLLSIEVSESIAAQVATAATAGQVGIVLLPRDAGTTSSSPTSSSASASTSASQSASTSASPSSATGVPVVEP
jgi:hypothetical protein